MTDSHSTPDGETDDCDGRCRRCGSETDHYLGCPEDPDPNYEAEAQAERDLLASYGDERECDCGDTQAHIQHI